MGAAFEITDRRTEIRVAGKTLYAPSTEIGGRTVVVTGKWLKKAAIKDENLAEGRTVENPAIFLAQLKRSRLQADIFTFCQKIPDTTPNFPHYFEWDNWAVIPITKYDEWWEKRVPQETRKNVRRAAKRGVTVRQVPFDDELVRGVHDIYNETPVRQGRRFWHYGKDVETVKRESATYLSRSEFLGAYFNDELIGFVKIVYVDQVATLLHILSKNAHQDKRPINALLAKAVEVCSQRGTSFLIYGAYTYDGNTDSPLTEFKRRNGFEELKYPRYFLPLTAKGKVAVQLRFHKGVKAIIPRPMKDVLRNWRSQFYQHRSAEADSETGKRVLGQEAGREDAGNLTPK
jgi:hypothetical protein